jgi:CubicO group peptidase (beta-lactamase class C family)
MGYALAGAVVESVSDRDFAEATAASIFEPLGMNNTSWRLADFDHNTLAEPTRYRNGRWEGQGHYTFADYPNGGLRSSAQDMACLMATFARGGELFGTRILETETLYEMMRTAYPRLDADQGLGWYYEDVGERKLWIGHSGAESGVATDTFMRQDGSLGFVVLANGDWGGTGTIYAIEDALLAHAGDL